MLNLKLSHKPQKIYLLKAVQSTFDHISQRFKGSPFCCDKANDALFTHVIVLHRRFSSIWLHSGTMYTRYTLCQLCIALHRSGRSVYGVCWVGRLVQQNDKLATCSQETCTFYFPGLALCSFGVISRMSFRSPGPHALEVSSPHSMPFNPNPSGVCGRGPAGPIVVVVVVVNPCKVHSKYMV